MANLIGQSFGRYQISEQLGEGGMAVVYKAYDTRLETDVAIKVIRTEILAPAVREQTLKRFEREAKALAHLTHPNIVKVIDYGDYEGKPYLVMPYLPGGTIKEQLGRPMPWQEAARLLLPLTHALAYAHDEGIVHRDVKPSNILITRTGEPMLTDFGIAKIIDDGVTVDLTGTNTAVGTPEYMAPEQVTAKTADHRADIYALGIVFYEMVTGRKPFMADTPMAVLFKQASEPLPRPTQFVANLPEPVEKVLIKALAKKRENRYQSMGEFGAALENLIAAGGQRPASSGKGVTPQRPPVTSQAEPTKQSTTMVQRPRARMTRAWPVIIVSAVVLGLCCIGLVIFLYLSGDSIVEMLGFGPTPIQPTAVQVIQQPTRTVEPTPVVILDNGEYIAFTTYRNGNGDIALIHPDGSGEVVLMTNPATDTDAEWSPDGQMIAFTSDRDGDNELYVMYSDGSNITQLTFNGADDAAPAWSPDGQYMAFLSNMSGNYEIHIMDLNNGEISQLTNLPNTADLDPAWSPDGLQIAFAAGDGTQFDIFVIDFDGSGLTQITNETVALDWFPAWSPLGDRIAVETNRYGSEFSDFDIIVVNPDGSNLTRLTTTTSNDSYPAWSPDGSRIAFVSNMDGNFEIYTMNPDGTDITRVTNSAGDDGAPDWQP